MAQPKYIILVLILLCCDEMKSVETIPLAITKYPITTKTTSSVPAYAAATVASGAALYCSGWGAAYLNSKPGIFINDYIDYGINFFQKRLVSEKILGIYAHNEEAHKESILYSSVALLLYCAKVVGEGYCIYKIGSITKSLTQLLSNRTVWQSQLVGDLQKQIKLIAIIRTTKYELEQCMQEIQSPDLKAIVLSYVARIEQLNQRYTVMVSKTLETMNDISRRYDAMTHKPMFNNELAACVEAVLEDFVRLSYGSVVTREDLSMIADDLNIGNITDRLNEIRQLTTAKDDASRWRGVRKMQQIIQSLCDQVEMLMQQKEQYITDALANGQRLVAWQVRIAAIPLLRQLI